MNHSKARGVTDLVWRAQAALEQVFPSFTRAGYDVDSDEWHAVGDLVLRTLVWCIALDTSLDQLPIGPGRYATWEIAAPDQAIRITPIDLDRIATASRVKGIHGIDTWAYGQPEPDLGGFQFIEFRDPRVRLDKPETLEVALGLAENKAGEQTLALFPHGTARFSVDEAGARSPAPRPVP